MSDRQSADPMIALLRASAKVRDGRWIKGAPTHVLADLLNELETAGWRLSPAPEGERETDRLRAENERLRVFAFSDAPEWEKANASLKHRVRELEAQLAQSSGASADAGAEEVCKVCGNRGWHTAGGNDQAACGACPAGEAWAEYGADGESSGQRCGCPLPVSDEGFCTGCGTLVVPHSVRKIAREAAASPVPQETGPREALIEELIKAANNEVERGDMCDFEAAFGSVLASVRESGPGTEGKSGRAADVLRDVLRDATFLDLETGEERAAYVQTWLREEGLTVSPSSSGDTDSVVEDSFLHPERYPKRDTDSADQDATERQMPEGRRESGGEQSAPPGVGQPRDTDSGTGAESG